MAGSRAEKIGTVFSRVQGLLRTGAMKEADKPVWFEVYAAFPPRVEPKYERVVRTDEPINILYREDTLRAKFHRTFISPDVVDMRQRNVPSVCQRFVERYAEMERSSSGALSDTQIIDAVAEALRSEGITLKTIAQLQQERDAARKAKESRIAAHKATLTSAARLSRAKDELFDDNLFYDDADDLSSSKEKREPKKTDS